MNDEDKILIKKWHLNRDHEAIRILYKKYERFSNYLLYKKYASLSEQVSDKEDVLNQAFYLAVTKYNPNTKMSFINFLSLRVRQSLIVAYRQELRERILHRVVFSALIEPEIATYESKIDSEEFRQFELTNLKKSISEKDWKILSLRYIDSLTLERIGEITEMSTETVRQRIISISKKLYNKIQHEFGVSVLDGI